MDRNPSYQEIKAYLNSIDEDDLPRRVPESRTSVRSDSRSSLNSREAAPSDARRRLRMVRRNSITRLQEIQEEVQQAKVQTRTREDSLIESVTGYKVQYTGLPPRQRPQTAVSRTAKRSMETKGLERPSTSLGGRQFRSPQKQIISSEPEVGSTYKPIGTVVKEVTTKARANLVEHLQTATIEEVRAEAQGRIDALSREHDMNIRHLRDEVDTTRREKHELLTELDSLKEENQALRNSVDLLRMKQRRLTSREIELQTKLASYEKVAPMFERLQHMKFQSPEDVVSRLDQLEQTQLESYTGMLETRERLAETEKELEHVRSEVENQIHKRTVHLASTLKESERKVHDLQASLDATNAALVNAKSYQDRYLALNFAVIDLWNKWHDRVPATEEEKAKFSEVDYNDPLQIVSSLMDVMIQFTPSRAGKAYQDLSGLANTFWGLFLDHDPVLKSKPRQIFLRIAEMLSEQQKEKDRSIEMLHHSRKEVQGLREDLDDVMRQKRRLQVELDGMKRKRLNKGATPARSRKGKQKGSEDIVLPDDFFITKKSTKG